MSWLIPAVLSTMIGTFIMILLYTYYYIEEKNRYMLLWSISWTIYLLRYVFLFLILTFSNNDFFFIGNQLSNLISGFFLLWGTYEYLGRHFSKYWLISFLPVSIWIVVSILLHFSFLALTLPSFTFIGLIMIFTGIIFLRAEQEDKLVRVFVGMSFILWGLHKLDYPFLRPVEWFAPIGYMIGIVFQFLIGLGIILLHFKRAKKQILDDSVKLKTIISTIPDLVWLKDPEGRYLLCNPKFEQFFGAKEDEILHKTDYDFVDKEQADFFREKDKAAMTSETPLMNEESVIYASDGHREDLETIKTAIKDSDGNVAGILGIARDISKRKQNLKNLNTLVESTIGHIGEELFKEAVKRTKEWLECDCVIIGKIVDHERIESIAMILEEKYVDSYAYPLIGTPCANVVQGRISYYPENVCQLFPQDSDLQNMKAQGYIGTPLYDVENKVLGVFCAISKKPLRIPEDGKEVLRIIAARLSAEISRENTEAALTESQRRFDLAMDASRDGLFDIDLKSKAVYLSPNWKGMLGYGNDELSEEFDELSELVKKEDLTKIKQTIRETFAKKLDRFELDIMMRHKEGQWKDILSRGSVYYDKEGHPSRILGTHADITNLKAMESHLTQTQKMESLGTLAGGIAHDFNNLLFPILGYSELLLRDLKEEKNINQVDYIIKNAERAQDLVKQILVFSRMNDEEPTQFKLQPVVEEVLKFMRSTVPKNVSILSDIEDFEGTVFSNPTKIHQIVMNLMTNAYHAIENCLTQEIHISLKREYQIENNTPIAFQLDQDREYALLSVKDSGVGMDESVSKRIFDPFFTTKEKGKGTGMGLSIIQSIIKSLSGAILVESEPNRGTTFEVFIPLSESTENPLDENEDSDMTKGQGSILVIDDEYDIAALEKEVLESSGYHVEMFCDGNKALEEIKKNPYKYDLVITDLSMPGISGEKLTEKIREVNANVPIVLCSGFSKDINKENIDSYGIAGFLNKPIKLSDLLATAEKLIQK